MARPEFTAFVFVMFSLLSCGYVVSLEELKKARLEWSAAMIMLSITISVCHVYTLFQNWALEEKLAAIKKQMQSAQVVNAN